jgi:hypothetical protein
MDTVKHPIKVSFKVGNMDYGVIDIPVGTKVERHSNRNLVCTTLYPWFVDDDRITVNEKIRSFFNHDVKYYGITIPNENVIGINGKDTHESFHF